MFPKNILVGFSLILLKSMITDGFQTDLCDHGNLTKLERKLQECLEEIAVMVVRTFVLHFNQQENA